MFREMRRKKQEISHEECVRILEREKRGVLAVLGDDGYPYAIPLDFYYNAEDDRIWFHCAQTGHKLDAIRRCGKVCFTVMDQGVRKDGDWAFYVTSVVVFGTAELVTDEAVLHEKLRALGLKYYPTAEEMEEELRRDIKRVQLVSIRVDHMTGKLVHEK